MAGRPIPPLRVLVPMKPLKQAKSRLWTVVPSLQRNGVTLMMLDTVVRAAVSAIGPTAVWVVGGDDLVQRVTVQAEARWAEDAGGGLNETLWKAMRAAYEEGCKATLFMPGDLPMVDASDVNAIAKASDDYTRPVGVQATDGGTNALLVPARCAFAPRLGLESFAKHAVAAHEAGCALEVLESPRVAFDVDSFDDFQWARDNVPGFNQKMHDWQARLRAEAAAGGRV